MLEAVKAALPELSPQAHARINAVRERCDALLGRAVRQHAKMIRDADLMADTRRSRSLRNRAHDVLQTAEDAAAVRLLDAQADEYLPQTGARFPYQTLEVLAQTAVDIYGGETAVALRKNEWRARWLDRKAAEKTPPAQAAIVSNSKGQRRKRGPERNYETATRVAEVVERVAPDDKWRSKLDDLLMALDDAEIPRPKTWQPKHGYRSWYAAVADNTTRGRHMAIEAIKHHLKRAKEKPTETIP
ncbi:MAG: hypothetical protein WBL65_20515 [Bryobacteraceae bacterium]